MNNKQIARWLIEFYKTREMLLERLNKNPYHSEAAASIIEYNGKIHFVNVLWAWADESVEYPYYEDWKRNRENEVKS